MQKLRCTSCNGDLEVDANDKYATCKFCGTKYKLDGDNVVVLNVPSLSQEDVKAMDKAFIPFAVVFGSIVAVITFCIVFFSFNMNKKHDVSSFNLEFSYSSGTQNPVFVGETLDNVITKNKTNDKHKITVVYNDKETQNEDEIIEIKKNLTERIGIYTTYEVKLYYDKDGYVNKIVIEG